MNETSRPEFGQSVKQEFDGENEWTFLGFGWDSFACVFHVHKRTGMSSGSYTALCSLPHSLNPPPPQTNKTNKQSLKKKKKGKGNSWLFSPPYPQPWQNRRPLYLDM